jgi:hypothetical protein
MDDLQQIDQRDVFKVIDLCHGMRNVMTESAVNKSGNEHCDPSDLVAIQNHEEEGQFIDSIFLTFSCSREDGENSFPQHCDFAKWGQTVDGID